nr:MAG TPA: hypothetical protein [Caudoviricetes sp.]
MLIFYSDVGLSQLSTSTVFTTARLSAATG